MNYSTQYMQQTVQSVIEIQLTNTTCTSSENQLLTRMIGTAMQLL